MKFNTLKFAISGGIVWALCYAVTTISTLLGIPGFAPFANLIESGYSYYGYTITWSGVIVGAIWGFLEGFIWIGLFGLIYNKLAGKK